MTPTGVFAVAPYLVLAVGCSDSSIAPCVCPEGFCQFFIAQSRTTSASHL